MSSLSDHIADQVSARFENDMNFILDAGLYPGPSPFADQLADCLFSPDGKPWPIPPSRMTVGDILHFVHVNYGEPYISFCRSFRQLRVH